MLALRTPRGLQQRMKPNASLPYKQQIIAMQQQPRQQRYQQQLSTLGFPQYSTHINVIAVFDAVDATAVAVCDIILYVYCWSWTAVVT